MQFYLSYNDVLSTTRHVSSKFKYRRTFLPQLRLLHKHHKENQLPLEATFSPDKMRFVGDFKFLPLVTKDEKKIIDLDIKLLSHFEPGCNIGYPTGDLDNLLKALIDGLRMAQNQNEIRDEKPNEGEEPFLVLLEDDQIIRNIQISHDRLFFGKSQSPKREKEIFALIKVTVLPKFPFV